MIGRTNQTILLLLASLLLSLFLVGHSLVVEAEFEACFGNYVASINGERPYERVGEMSLGELVFAAGRQFSDDQLILAVFGLFPLVPFIVAWLASKTERTRKFWIVSALVAAVVIIIRVSSTSLTSFYDCDRNGVSIAILLGPLLYMTVNAVAAPGLAGVRFLARHLVDRA